MEKYIEASYPLIHQKGTKDDLYIKIFKPEKDPKALYGDYFCAFEIKASQLEVQDKAFGIDGLQALWLTLKRIQELVRDYESQQNVKCEYFSLS